MSGNIQAVLTASGWDVDGPMTTQALAEVDTNGIPTGQIVTPSGQPVGGGRVDETIRLPDGQPLGITKPVTKPGRIAVDFAPGRCTAISGTGLTLEQGYTGYSGTSPVTPQSRTGLPHMLKVTVTDDSTRQLQITNAQLGGSGFTATEGKLGLWVYVDNSQNVGGGIGALSINLYNTTNWSANSTRYSFNSNQIRPGWNFLVLKQIKPISEMPALEVHFLGLTAQKFGDGSSGDIRSDAIRYITFDLENMNGNVLYFDSLWTDFDQLPTITFGVDQASNDTRDVVLPMLKEKGWKGYFAPTFRVWTTGSKIVNDFNTPPLGAHTRAALYSAGWDCVNHTVNHLSMGGLISPAEIRYEYEMARSWYLSDGLTRGLEFYASPQSSTSQLAEGVAKACGIVLQRHGANTHSNVHVTQFGVDNPSSIGSFGLDDPTIRKFSEAKKIIDMAQEYRCSIHLFCHAVTELGDSGSGEDVSGSTNTIMRSMLQKTFDYIADLEAQGKARMVDGFTGFYYGTGR